MRTASDKCNRRGCRPGLTESATPESALPDQLDHAVAEHKEDSQRQNLPHLGEVAADEEEIGKP